VHTLIGVLLILLNVLSFLVLVQVILSLLISFNVVNRYNGFVSSVDGALDQLLAPMYRLLRRVLPATGGIDWAPFALLIVIRVLMYVLSNLDASLTYGTPM
jgi:YggT family protein